MLDGNALAAYFDKVVPSFTQMSVKEYCKVYKKTPRPTIDKFISSWVASNESVLGALGKDGRPGLNQVAEEFPTYLAKRCGGDVTP